MVSASRYLVDTNVLLRLSVQDDPQHRLIGSALKRFERQGAELCYSLQNIAEFWNVCTRPRERNGFGLSIAETNQSAAYIERSMTFLPDSELVYSIWRQLVVDNHVRGVQVHDARLAAVMLAYGVSRILTMNQTDFERFTEIQAIHPSQIHH